MRRHVWRSVVMGMVAAAFTSCGGEGTSVAATALSASVPATTASAATAIDASRRTAIVTATERVAPAIVSITSYETRIVRGRAPVSNDMFDQFFRDFLPPTRLYRERVPSLGSGIIVDADGLIVTNAHVVGRAEEIVVTLPDGRAFPATVVAGHAPSDVAVLRVEGVDLPAAVLGSSESLMVGEWVIALGNPFGQLISDTEPTVTIGVVSAKKRSFLPRQPTERKYLDMIQTDAAINPGNSGGALANALGEVVGINTFILSRSGGSMGLGFAIPIDHVKRVLTEYRAHGRVRDVWLGFKFGAISAAVQQALELRDTHGVVVTEVHRRGPAYAGGLRPGDIITGINGRPVGDVDDAQLALGYVFAGDTFAVDLERQGRPERLTMEALVAE